MLFKALKLLRTLNDMSQANLAKELRISNSYLCQIESGKKKPTLDLVEAYSTVFKMPPSTILMFSEKLSDSAKERSRVFMAERVLRIIDALAGDDADGGDTTEKEKPVHPVSC